MKLSKLLLVGSAIFLLGSCGGGEETQVLQHLYHQIQSYSALLAAIIFPPRLNHQMSSLHLTMKFKKIVLKKYNSFPDYIDEIDAYEFQTVYEFKYSEIPGRYNSTVLSVTHDEDTYNFFYKDNNGSQGDFCVSIETAFHSESVGAKLVPLTEATFLNMKNVQSGTYTSSERVDIYDSDGSSRGQFTVGVYCGECKMEFYYNDDSSYPTRQVLLSAYEVLDAFTAKTVGIGYKDFEAFDYDAENFTFKIVQKKAAHGLGHSYFSEIEVSK